MKRFSYSKLFSFNLVVIMTILLLSFPAQSYAQNPEWTDLSLNWTSIGTMPTSRSWSAAVTYAGKIYIIGGCSCSSNCQQFGANEVGSLEVYDPLSDTWTTKMPMPTARIGAAAAVVNGKIYVMGGFNQDYWSEDSIVEQYDIATNSWSRKSPMPTGRSWFKAVVLNNKIYALGGVGYGYLNNVEMYDPETCTWTEKARFNNGRYMHGAAVVNNRIYVIGGDSWENGSDEVFSDIQEYDPATDSWTERTPMPTALSDLNCGVFGRKIVVFNSKWCYAYNTTTDRWQQVQTSNCLSYNFSAAQLDTTIYKFGGGGWGPTSSIVQRASITVIGSKKIPDMKVLTIIPQNPVASEPTTIDVSIKNVGKSASSSGDLRLGVLVLTDKLKPFQGQIIDVGNIASVPPGSTQTVSIPFTFLSSSYSKYLEISLIPQPGMDENVQNNTTRVLLGVAPNKDTYLNCIDEVATILSLGLIQGQENLKTGKDIIFYGWDEALNNYKLDEAIKQKNLKRIITIFGTVAWDTGSSVLKLGVKKIIGRMMSYIKGIYSLFAFGKNESHFQGCGEILPQVWDELKAFPGIIWDHIKNSGQKIYFFILDSPGDLIIEDSNGNITSVTADTTIKEGIENSFAFGFNNHKAVMLMGNDQYKITLKGTATGTCGLSIFKPGTKDSFLKLTYNSIPTTEHSQASLTVSQNISQYDLQIDSNGDGIIDETKAPDSVQVVTSMQQRPNNLRIPKHFFLYQNWPNPFNPTTHISYEIAKGCHVELTVCNLLGKKLKTLVNSFQSAGSYQVNFNAKGLPSGLYLYRLQAGDFVQTKRMVLIK